jgi:hypothetical protein
MEYVIKFAMQEIGEMLSMLSIEIWLQWIKMLVINTHYSLLILLGKKIPKLIDFFYETMIPEGCEMTPQRREIAFAKVIFD